MHLLGEGVARPSSNPVQGSTGPAYTGPARRDACNTSVVTRTFDASALTDDELRAAVTEAKARLTHIETCDHCAERHRSSLVDARNHLTWVQGFNERAAEAGYVVGSKNGTIHRWDCPSIQSLVRSVLKMAEDDVGVGDRYEVQLPAIATAKEARELIDRPTPKRRTCRTCSPDL